MKLMSLGKQPQPPSALELLKTQHEEVKVLFKRIEKASTRAAKTKLFDELAANLAAHDAIEREIFYPACEKALGMIDLLGEALVEHGVVEFSLYQADQARKDKDFSFKCQVLSEIVEHHVKEEESDFFPKVQKALGKEKLLELGARMQARFEQAKAKDYHGALNSNLKQVLAGALKPSKRGSSSRKAPALPSGKRRKAAA
ncbi:MAG TPA: hemerythrin domain-containing protein [Polyangiaceae bacterium]|nr:hemerythrin domain-containing protein [Polyangiaceae bacterium]